MVNDGENKRRTYAEPTDAAQGIRGVGSRIAPAVALLLLGDSAYAQVVETDDSNPVAVPEPSILGRLAGGAARCRRRGLRAQQTPDIGFPEVYCHPAGSTHHLLGRLRGA